ncbi:MAG: hypothetical protein Ct9H300mP1_05360 [Planctomycetaceae bacterium]|nr:MAG: hypothetical protein Ct9H300mP1_05360 [Planctomycetaceae bacterium]
MLPRLLERSGRTTAGSITGFYTVLVERETRTTRWPKVFGRFSTGTWFSRVNWPTGALAGD